MFCHSPRSRMCVIPCNRVSAMFCCCFHGDCHVRSFTFCVTVCSPQLCILRHTHCLHKSPHMLQEVATHMIIEWESMPISVCCWGHHSDAVQVHPSLNVIQLGAGFAPANHTSLARVLVRFPGHFIQKAVLCNWLPAPLASLWDLTEESNPRPVVASVVG